MASTKDKYDKLSGTVYDTDGNSTQLIYPIDLAGGLGDHPGLVVVFELNRLSDSTGGDYVKGLVSPSSRLVTMTNSGLVNSEVAMQRDAGSKSLRQGTETLKTGGGYLKTEQTIILPPPQQWQDNLVVNWQSVDMASIGSASDFGGSVMDGDAGTAVSQIKASLPKMLAGGIQNIGGPNLRSFSEMVTGSKQNAYSEVLFGNVNNRFFPFQWTFTPRNRKEAEVVRSIIHRFRWAAVPEMMFGEKNGSFFKAPWTFDIHFIDLRTGRESKWWPRIGTCALTNISTNRTPTGEFAVLSSDEDETGEIPAAITLELQFTELFILDKSNMDKKDESY